MPETSASEKRMPLLFESLVPVVLLMFSASYVFFAFLNLIDPLVSIFYGYTGITMHKIEGSNSSPNELNFNNETSIPIKS